MALSDVIGRLAAHLDLETTAFEKNSGKARREVNTLERHISKAGVVIKGAFAGMLGAFAINEIVAVTQRGLEYASSLEEVAAQLGVTTKALQEYRYAASQAGVEQGEMDQALAQLTRRLGDAAEGAKAPTAALEKLGINVRDARGHVLDAGDAIPLIAEGLQKIESPAERAAILVDLFGKAGQKLAPLLEGGAEGVNNLRKAAHELGIVLSEDQIQKADETADKLSAMKQVLEARIAGAVADNADAILGLVDALTKLVVAAGNAVTAWQKWRNAVGGANAMEENKRIQATNRGDTVNGSALGFESRTLGSRGAWLPSGSSILGATRKFRPGLPKGGRGGGGDANAIGGSAFGGGFGDFAPGSGEAGWMRMAAAANDMARPVAQIDTMMARMATGSGVQLARNFRDAALDLERTADAAQSILDRLYPEDARARQYMDDLRVLKQRYDDGGISAAKLADAQAKLNNEFVRGMPAVDQINKGFGRYMAAANDAARGSELVNVRVAQSFKDMADQSLAALDRVANAVKGGGFLNILSSVIGLGLQLGGAGLFGKNVQTNINRVPAYAGGTNYHPGGLALVGERGPELVSMSRGSKVIPNDQLGAMQRVEIVDTTGLFKFRVDGQIMAASPSIASAGASGGVAKIARSNRRAVG